MPGIVGICEMEVVSKDGKVLHSDKKPMDSFVDNLCDALAIVLLNSMTGIELVNTSNVAKTIFDYQQGSSVVALASDDSFGIVVGSGVGAFDHALYCLGTKIQEGVGAGQLLHGLEIATAPAWSATKWTFSKYRTFTNSSGAPVTVSEHGLYGKIYPNVVYYSMLAREVFAPVALPDGSTMRITYNFELTA